MALPLPAVLYHEIRIGLPHGHSHTDRQTTDGTANSDFGAGGNANVMISYKRCHCGISGRKIVDYLRVS